MANLQHALEAWANAIGKENVLTDEKTLSAVQTTNFFTTQTVPAVICPANREQVQQCLKIANEFKIPVYPISCGKNWGYGSRVPVKDGCVVIDLGRMNKITEFNEELAYVTVEPGVTFKDLYLFLAEKESNLFMSVTGASIDASLIGNILERGIGKGPYGERCNHACAFEVVLPTGDFLNTGFGRFANAQATSISHWGVGPNLESLFTQSNLGIVTKMTIWLNPIPKYFQTFYYNIKTEAQLYPLIDTLRELKQSGTIRTNFILTNDYRQLSVVQQYPWSQTNQTPLSEELLQKLKQAKSIDYVWTGEGAIYCDSQEQSQATQQVIKEALKDKVDQLLFFNEKAFWITFMLQYSCWWIKGADLLDRFRLAYNKSAMIGFPRNKGLLISYWRKKTPISPNLDLDKDRCGTLWISPSLPFSSHHVKKAMDIVKDTMSKYKFEPNLGLNCITERRIDVTTVIVYDREDPEEDKQAKACYYESLNRLMKEGYFPYRLNINSMDALPTPDDDYAKALKLIKQALDPNDILAPGRYDFRNNWPE